MSARWTGAQQSLFAQRESPARARDQQL